MSPLLGPILAQLVSLGVSDRTEVRYLSLDPGFFEASTAPRAALNFGWKHTSLTLGYGPSLTLTPLESIQSQPRRLLVFHNALVSGSYHWRHTTFTATESLGFGEVEFQALALGTGGIAAIPPSGNASGVPVTVPTGPPTAGMMPVQGTVQVNGTNGQVQILKYATSASDLIVTQVVSPVFTVSGDLGYTVTGSYGASASANYPLVKGPRAVGTASYRFTRQDTATSTLYVQESSSSVRNGAANPTVPVGDNSWIALANEGWAHAFDQQTSTLIGAGLGVTRTSQPGGPVTWSIYPTFNASITRFAPLGRGLISYGLGISAAPMLDAVSATVDPRLSFFGFTGWSRDRFSANLAAGSTLSLDSQGGANARGFNSVNGSFILGYRLSAAVSVDSGLRAAYQKYAGVTTIPWTWSAFLGLTFAAATPL